MAFGVGIFVCSATATIIVLAFRTTRMNTPSGVLLFILVLLAGTLLMVPIAIWYRRQMELARTKIVPIPNSADKLRLLAYDTVGASKLFRNLSRRKSCLVMSWQALLEGKKATQVGPVLCFLSRC